MCWLVGLRQVHILTVQACSLSRQVIYMVVLSFYWQLSQLATLSSSTTTTTCKCIHSLNYTLGALYQRYMMNELCVIGEYNAAFLGGEV